MGTKTAKNEVPKIMKLYNEMSLVERVRFRADYARGKISDADYAAAMAKPDPDAEAKAKAEAEAAEKSRIEAEAKAAADAEAKAKADEQARIDAEAKAKAEADKAAEAIAANKNLQETVQQQAEQIKDLQAIVDLEAYGDAVPGRKEPVKDTSIHTNPTGGADLAKRFVSMTSAEKTEFLANGENHKALFEAIKNSPLRGPDGQPYLAVGTAQSGSPTFDLTSLGLAVISRKTLRRFGAALSPVKAFTTDFSDEVVTGATVTTRVFPLGTGAREVNDDLSGNIASAAADTTPTPVTVYIDGTTANNSTYPADGFGITAADLQLIASGVWPSVAETGMQVKTYNVAKAILKNAFARLTAANFSAIPNINAIAEANVDSDLLSQIGGELKPIGFQDGMMSLLLTSKAHAALIRDPYIKNSYNLQANSIVEGKSPNIMGFNVVECPTLPFTGSTPETEKLIGFACMPGAVAIAARPIVLDAATAAREYVYFETMTEPITGFPVTIACQYDRTRWAYNWIVLTRAGSAKADAYQGYRLVKP